MKFSDVLQGTVPLENGWQNIQPRISVILPTFNRHTEGRLLPCIHSVLAQSFQDFEFIIFDDGSSDGSAGVIRSLAETDPRIVLISLPKNTGLPAVLMNAGVLRSRGEYTAFTFDDNTLHPNALQQLWAAAQTNRADVVHAQMRLHQSNGRERSLGVEPASLMSLELNNTIPNGAVLVHRSFWDRYGLYDPHILLRRVCDWDLWLRALKQGAYFYHLPIEIGVEYGLTLKTSLGNSIRWDYKLLSAYLQDDRALSARTKALLPDNIPDYDILDGERLLPYIRNWAEWDTYESEVMQPFLKVHPKSRYTPIIRHNRRYEKAFQPFQINANRPIFHPRKRILIICEQYNRLVAEWVQALSENPNHILVVSSPGSAILMDPSNLDQVIVCDTGAPVLPPFLEKCRQNLVPSIFISSLPSIPIEHEMLIGNCDDAYSFQEEPPSILLNSIHFLPCPVVMKDGEEPPCLAVFCDTLPSEILLAALASQSINNQVKVFIPPGEPSLQQLESFKNLAIIQTAEPLSQWVTRLHNVHWLVMSGVFAGLSVYERSLLEEDTLRNHSLMTEFDQTGRLPGPAEHAEKLRSTRIAWNNKTIGHHTHGRQLQLQNIVTGVALRSRLARQHKKNHGRDVNTLVFVNSRLFGGSEVFGFLTAWTLGRIGFKVQTCVPDFDHYKAGGAKMAEWLAERHMSAPIHARYGEAGRVFFDPEFVPNGVMDQSQALANWIFEQDTDLVFCSGFIPEPILASGKKLPVFAAFFPPWGYALNRMTFLRHYLEGLASDSEWALKIWGRWLPEPRMCIPSLIESHRFKVLNQDLPADPINIALVGTMVHMKGHRQALLAVEQLISEGYNLHLNIYGFELEIYADFIQQIKKMAERPLLKGRVTFHGFVDDAQEINRDNHLILSASLAEGLPQALAFHQASGLLPVASPAGGIPEIVIDGQTGFLANGFLVQDLVLALRRALQNRSNWPQIIANGQHLLIETASEPVFVSRMLTWMERGLDIRLSEGRHYFTNKVREDNQSPAIEMTGASDSPKYKTPVAPAIKDESRMVCSPPLDFAPLIYTLHCTQDHLSNLRLRLATFITHPQGQLLLEIYPTSSKRLLRCVIVPAASVLDNAWMEVSFEPLQNLLGQMLEVHIRARLTQGRLAVYENVEQGSTRGIPEKTFRLGRRILQITGRRPGEAVFYGEAE